MRMYALSVPTYMFDDKKRLFACLCAEGNIGLYVHLSAMERGNCVPLRIARLSFSCGSRGRCMHTGWDGRRKNTNTKQKNTIKKKANWLRDNRRFESIESLYVVRTLQKCMMCSIKSHQWYCRSALTAVQCSTCVVWQFAMFRCCLRPARSHNWYSISIFNSLTTTQSRKPSGSASVKEIRIWCRNNTHRSTNKHRNDARHLSCHATCVEHNTNILYRPSYIYTRHQRPHSGFGLGGQSGLCWFELQLINVADRWRDSVPSVEHVFFLRIIL